MVLAVRARTQAMLGRDLAVTERWNSTLHRPNVVVTGAPAWTEENWLGRRE